MKTKTKFRLGLVLTVVLATGYWLSKPGEGVAYSMFDGEDTAASVAAPAHKTPDRAKSGKSAKGGSWQLVQPVIDNRAAFAKYFPNADYLGDYGDQRHQNANPPHDHTPYSADDYDGCSPKKHWIYAQDLGGGGGFDLTQFVRWLVDHAGDYPELKYVISQMPKNKSYKGGRYYGNISRKHGWQSTYRKKLDHAGHIHLSYMMTCGSFKDMEHHHSSIIADYHDFLTRK